MSISALGPSTLELLPPCVRGLMSIAARLDVDDDTLLKMLGNIHFPQHPILHCRENVRPIQGLMNGTASPDK